MKENNFFYKFVKYACYPFFMIFYHPKIIGKNNYLKKEGYILAGNHTKSWDVFLMVATNKRKIHFFTKSELFTSKFKNWFFTSFGCIPINRKEKNKDAVNKGINYLKHEKIICIFPEGTINRTEDIIMPFKLGAVKMAYESKKPIIPFAIVGKYKIFGKSATAIIGEPYYVKSSDLVEENKKLEEKVIQLIKEHQK